METGKKREIEHGTLNDGTGDDPMQSRGRGSASGVVVRGYREGDADRLTKLFDALGLRHMGPEGFKGKGEEKWVEDLVAETRDGELAGRVRFEYPYPPYGEIVNMGVHPDHRRKGIGEALLRACIDLARSSGNEVIQLQTDFDNLAAHHMYAKHGFIYAIPRSADSHGMIGLLNLRDISIYGHFYAHYPFATMRKPTRIRRPGHCRIREWSTEVTDPLSGALLAVRVRGTPAQVDMPVISGWRFEDPETHTGWQIASDSLPRSLAPGSETRIQVTAENLPESERDLEVALESVYPPVTHTTKIEPICLSPGQSSQLDIEAKVPSALDEHISASSYPNIPVTCSLRVSRFALPVTISFFIGNA